MMATSTWGTIIYFGDGKGNVRFSLVMHFQRKYRLLSAVIISSSLTLMQLQDCAYVSILGLMYWQMCLNILTEDGVVTKN